jgi:hypothetical protein
MAVHVVTDRPARAASRRVPELAPSLIWELLGVAVTPALHEWNRIIRQFVNIQLATAGSYFVRQTATPNDKPILKFASWGTD